MTQSPYGFIAAIISAIIIYIMMAMDLHYIAPRMEGGEYDEIKLSILVVLILMLLHCR